MQDQPTSTIDASLCDQFAGPFRLLAIDPTATSAEVEQAYALARRQAVVSDQRLTEARDVILDPARRLLCELAYPLDSSAEQVIAFYHGLSGNDPVSQLIVATDDLPPLSRANFLAHLAARKAADADLMLALVGAHAAVDAAAIFEILKARRSRAGFPMPPLLGIRQDLQELFTAHAEAVVAAYGTIQGAAAPLSQCIRQVLSSDDRHQVEALNNLLDAYRRSLAKVNPATSQEIDAACDAIEQRPDDVSLIAQFEKTLADWISTRAPLILFDAHQTLRNEEVNRIVARMRRLPADLIANGDYETPQKIVAVCLDALNLVPGNLEPFKEAATALRKLSLEASIKSLENLIKALDREPDLVAVAIQRTGFGRGSNGEARTLWEAFLRAVTATSATELQEQPWISIRDFAFRLGARPESGEAATRLISDLLRFGETLPAAPTTLDTLRESFSKLGATHGPTELSRIISHAKSALFIILASIVMFCAFLAYRHYSPGPLRLTAAAPQSVPMEEPEAIPKASTGERFKREFVRYCHFQEERLRVIKQHVQGAQDFQAYNMLANDYNSRCSNFYYLEEDLKIVKEEVKARKQTLEADAIRILSTWPWHAAPEIASTPAAR